MNSAAVNIGHKYLLESLPLTLTNRRRDPSQHGRSRAPRPLAAAPASVKGALAIGLVQLCRFPAAPCPRGSAA